MAFGWLPALIWILIGSVFIGGVHDFAALVASTDQLADISALTRLLRQAKVEAAARYRQRLDDLFNEVRQHLKQAADLFSVAHPAAPRRASPGTAGRPRTRR